MSRLPAILKVALAWFPFYVAWILFILAYTGGEVSAVDAHHSGMVAIGTAAILGFFVWRFTGRLPWPDGPSVRFYAAHVVVGVLFAVLWTAVGSVVEMFRFGIQLQDYWAEIRRVVGWQLLMGVWIYGGVAAVSYTLRTRQRLREQERTLARAQALAAEAQLRALRAQLNPHFLFNALHSVSFLVQDDPEEAEAAIDQLGGLLRYALDEGGGDEVLLMDEWSFTSAYLDLESIRFGSRLRVEADIDPEAMACPVPPFSLQPLVENAVKHGIDPRPEGGLIRVGARVVDETLEVTVRDDGPGLSPDRPADAEGHGLGDLRRRLDALFGGRASLVVGSAEGDGCRVVLRLPADGGTPGADRDSAAPVAETASVESAPA